MDVSVPLRGFGYLKLLVLSLIEEFVRLSVSVPLRGFGYLKHFMTLSALPLMSKGFRPLAGIWLSKTLNHSLTIVLIFQSLIVSVPLRGFGYLKPWLDM